MSHSFFEPGLLLLVADQTQFLRADNRKPDPQRFSRLPMASQALQVDRRTVLDRAFFRYCLMATTAAKLSFDPNRFNRFRLQQVMASGTFCRQVLFLVKQRNIFIQRFKRQVSLNFLEIQAKALLARQKREIIYTMLKRQTEMKVNPIFTLDLHLCRDYLSILCHFNFQQTILFEPDNQMNQRIPQHNFCPWLRIEELRTSGMRGSKTGARRQTVQKQYRQQANAQL